MDIYNWVDIYPLAAINEDVKEDIFNNCAAEINALLGPTAWKSNVPVKVVGKSITFKDGKYILSDDAGKEYITATDSTTIIKMALLVDRAIEKAKAAKKPAPQKDSAKEEVGEDPKKPDPDDKKAKPNYGVKKNDKGLEWELEIPIFKLYGSQQLCGGVVYEPDVVDAQGDSASEEEIQKAAHNFMIDSKTVGIMHKEEAGPRAKIVESYIAPSRMQVGDQFVKRGTWIMVVKIMDDALWNQVKENKITGFSMGGRASETPQE